MLGRGSYPNNMGTVQAKMVNHENNNPENTAKENTVCKNPKASGNDGDDGHGDNTKREVQPSNRSLHPPMDFSNAVTGEDDDKENHHDEGDDNEDEEDDGPDEEEDHRDAAAHDEDQTKEDYNREEDNHEGDDYEDDEEDDDGTNSDAATREEAEAEEDEEEDTRAAASTKSTAEPGTAPREPPIGIASLTSDTEVKDIPEEARGVTSLPPESRPRNGPAPTTVQVENALAVQVGNGNVLMNMCPAQTEVSENATPASCGEACQPHIGAATVAVYITNCGVVQVGNYNRVVIEKVTPKVTPQENSFMRVCCELDIDPESGDHIHERLSHEDVRRQFAKKMAESFKVTCKIRSATKGCILLELEVPTEEDRLQLLRMARDGTFQQVLLETFLPEFAAEGRAVNMNLAIGVRNPSQAMVEELQGAVASNSHEHIKVIEIPDGVSPDTVDAAVPEQPEPHPGHAESSEQPDDDTGSVEDSPDVGQRDAPVSPDVDRRPASDTDDISKLTSLMRILSDPGDAEDETREEETNVSSEGHVGDMAIEESNADIQVSEDNNDQHNQPHVPPPRISDQRLPTNDERLPTNDERLPTNDERLPTTDQRLPTTDQRLPTNDQRLPTNDQRLPTNDQPVAQSVDDQAIDDQSDGHSVSLTSDEATCRDLSAHPEAPSDVTASTVFERSKSQETGDEETSKLLRRLALALDRGEWRQVAQALRIQQPDKDLSAGDTDLRIKILRDWQKGPSYGEQFDKLLLTLEACGRDDFAVELLQSAPQTIYTTSRGHPIRAVAETPSGVPTQVRETAQVFKRPKKPRKPPVDPRTPLRRMPYTLMKKISMELDPPGPLVGWRDVASHAGYSMQEIRVFDMEYLRPDGSPTRALLQAWGTRNATIQDLETALRQTGLLNVAEMLAPDRSDDEDV